MKVNREAWIRELEQVQPGLSTREIVEQSSCFCFQGKTVVTYNDEVSCSHQSSAKLQGAIQADKLMAVLQKLPEEELEVTQENGELLLRGKNRRAGLRMEAEILLPIDTVEPPGEWKPLPEEFTEGLQLVQECAGKDESKLSLTCVHITPKWLEACDNYQMARYRLKTGVAKSFLVRKNSIKHITGLAVEEFAESDNWVHFRNSDGLVLSCRRWFETYPKLSGSLEMTECHEIQLPKGLGDAVDKAEIFSADNVGKNHVYVKLEPGKVRIRGESTTGWYQETKKLPGFTGEALSFVISPKLLHDIVRKYNQCQINEERLRIDGGKFTYVTCLGVPEDVK